MAKSNGLNFNLPSVDDLFSTEESRAEDRLERVVNLNPAEISDFPNHPFKVRMDAAMQEMAESVKQYGVLVPALVRPKQGGGYEMVAGHRRKMAAELAQLPEIPCIVRNLTDDEATIIMVDSNLQREQILPSEKAFAYKMKLDAIRRQPGTRTDLTSVPLGQRLGQTSREALADKSPDSNTQIQRYIRLTRTFWNWWTIPFCESRKCCKSPCVPRWSCPTCEKKNRQTCLPSWMKWTVHRPMHRQSKCGRCPKPRPAMSGLPKMPLSPL